MIKRIAVIGAGASGMVAAIAAAQMGIPVVMFEQNKRVGQKLLKTGNGKCNLSNMDMGMENFYTSHPARVKAVLDQFTVEDTLAFFARLGVMVRERKGLYYPYSEQAQVVLDALRLRLDELRVATVHGGAMKTAAKRGDGRFAVGGELFDKVIVATGSIAGQGGAAALNGYKMAEAAGHRINPLASGLCRLICRDDFFNGTSGVRCQAKLTMLVNGKEAAVEHGELQFADGGLSGIPVFQMSRLAAMALADGAQVEVVVDFFSAMSDDEYEDFCQRRWLELAPSGRGVSDFLLGMTHKRLNRAMMARFGFRNEEIACEVGESQMIGLMAEYRHTRFHISEAEAMTKAQVCAGGVSFEELGDNLESLKVPGLYFAGEMLDVDGRCGGYNLQWAWSSGYVTGESAARKISS